MFGTWEATSDSKGNSGTLIWKVEHRHKYGEIPPSALQFELGGIGLVEPPFSDQGGRVTNLYWRQRLAGGKVTLLGGLLDATDPSALVSLGELQGTLYTSGWLGDGALVLATPVLLVAALAIEGEGDRAEALAALAPAAPMISIASPMAVPAVITSSIIRILPSKAAPTILPPSPCDLASLRLKA